MMGNSKKIGWLIAFSVCILISACEDSEIQKEAIEDLVDREVAARIEQYTLTLEKKCLEKVFIEANRIVDSMLIMDAKLSLDTIDRPPKPEKPETPEIKLLEDSLQVAPLFNQDSLDRQ